MRLFILVLTFLCTFGTAFSQEIERLFGGKEISIHQFQLSIEAGIGYGVFNKTPALPDPTTDPIVEEKLRAVGGEAFAFHLSYMPADKKIGYGLRLQYLNRGYQHIYIERPENAILLRDELTSEVSYLDLLPSLTYVHGRQLSFGGGPYYSVALSEKSTPDNLSPGQRLQRQDYGVHLNGRFSVGRFYLWTQYQYSLKPFDLSAFATTYPAVRPIQDPSPVSMFVLGLGFQVIR